MRLFLDANILFSAAKSDGAVRELLTRLVKAGHELRADAYVVEEARRNIEAKAPAAIEALQLLLRTVTLDQVTGRSKSLAPLPEKDRPVLEGAIRQRCHILVTGDRTHFGRLYGRTIEGVEILAPAQVAERLLR